MTTPAALKKYRIGDFAHYLGVSPTYLKHYESNGLLNVQTAESGYRFYSFDQSARVLEYLRLKSYGVNVKDMQALLESTPTAAMHALNAKTDELRAEIARMQSVVEEHERLQAWMARRAKKPINWEITDVEPYYFLFHSHMTDFLKDEAIYEILQAWVAWLPITKSALYVRQGKNGEPTQTFWGLAIPCRLAERYQLPINKAVIKLTFEKTFVFHFCGLKGAFGMKSIVAGEHPAQVQMAKLGFAAAGDALLLNEMRLSDKDGQATDCLGRFLIPIASD